MLPVAAAYALWRTQIQVAGCMSNPLPVLTAWAAGDGLTDHAANLLRPLVDGPCREQPEQAFLVPRDGRFVCQAR